MQSSEFTKSLYFRSINEIFPMQLSKFEIFILVESYDEKLLKITEIATLPKRSIVYFSIKDINPEFW